MDADRFDTLAKRLVAPATRRATLSTAVAGGLLSALGLGRALPETAAVQRGGCVLTFVATVRQGPNAAQALTPGGTQPGELRGELSFSLTQSGDLQEASLALPNGTTLPVVGQATGHSLQLRIAAGPQLALVAVGVGEQEVATCQGAIDGVISGPSVGDLGDWHATAVGQTDRGGGSNAGGSTGRTPEGRNQAPAGPATGTDSTGRTGRGDRNNRTGPTSPTGPTGPSGSTAPSGPTGTTGATGSGACPTGQSECAGRCVDLTSDDDNCGTCGTVCGPVSAENPSVFTFCENGVCVAPQCPAGTTDCSNYCADLMTSEIHCGACGKPCAADQLCQNGVCTAAQPCAIGLTNCDGVCVDLNVDAAHCGECGVSCVAGYVCVGGDCQDNANPPAPAACAEQGQSCAAADCCLGFCNQDEICECVSDGSECAGIGTGGCCSGQPCNADGFCGTCRLFGVACNSDAECCSGGQYGAALCCFDGVSLTTRCTDVTNIGFVCPGDPVGPVTCPAGQTDCGGECADLMANAGHCGACGNSCGLGGVCSGGVCGPPPPTCLVNGSPCTFGVDVCCAGLTCYSSICQCSPPGDVCVDPGVCCSGVCNGDGFCA